ncbi:MAG: TonB-dependent receptor [Bacteroidales bacterium]|nr:TonB-dependent receptor [Bacteroidales bacterium]
MISRFWALAVSLLILPSLALNAQGRRVTVSGYITDSATGETLIGAGAVSVDGSGSRIGAVTNSYGYYSLTIPSGNTSIQYSYVGYGMVVETVRLVRDTVINVALDPSAAIRESVVVASRDAGIQSTYLGAMEVPLAQIRNTPVLFGESDVLKAIQMMPGVQGGNEGFTGLYVRGGGPDENLILMDGVPIYNVDHMMGLFSVFQSEAVKKVTLYKGSFPARYGGRTSSILDIRTNDGNMKETHGSLGIGLISDKLHLEGPILKDRLSYSLSARGMHTAVFAPVIRAILKDTYANYYFYDLTGKVTWRLSDRDRFFLGAYHGRDKFLYKEYYDWEGYEIYDDGSRTDYSCSSREGMDLHWGNTVGSLRWNHIFSNRLFSNATVAYNRYKMSMGSESFEKGKRNGVKYKENYNLTFNSGIRDLSARMDLDFTPNPSYLVKFGGEYIYHTFIPETLTALEQSYGNGMEATDTTLNFIDNKRYRGHELSVYAEDDWSLGRHVTVNPGVHIALFVADGKPYISVQPRVSSKFSLDCGVSFKAGYARMAQYVHLLSSAQISLPVDLWVPITRNIRPVTSDQFSAGTYYDGLKGWEFSVEGYYKAMNNILEYKDGTLLLGNSGCWEEKVEMGKGRAMGVEFFIQKTTGKATGWIAYTLAKSDRLFPEGNINHGERFPYKYDRRHSLDISFNYEFTPRLELNATCSFASGGTTTLPEKTTAVLLPDRDEVISADYISHRNNYRLPPSHRMNVGLNVHRPHKRRGEGIWNFSVYNLYNYKNPNFVFVSYDQIYDAQTGETTSRPALKKITILPILPSISYTFKF